MKIINLKKVWYKIFIINLIDDKKEKLKVIKKIFLNK